MEIYTVRRSRLSVLPVERAAKQIVRVKKQIEFEMVVERVTGCPRPQAKQKGSESIASQWPNASRVGAAERSAVSNGRAINGHDAHQE